MLQRITYVGKFFFFSFSMLTCLLNFIIELFNDAGQLHNL